MRGEELRRTIMVSCTSSREWSARIGTKCENYYFTTYKLRSLMKESMFSACFPIGFLCTPTIMATDPSKSWASGFLRRVQLALYYFEMLRNYLNISRTYLLTLGENREEKELVSCDRIDCADGEVGGRDAVSCKVPLYPYLVPY